MFSICPLSFVKAPPKPACPRFPFEVPSKLSFIDPWGGGDQKFGEQVLSRGVLEWSLYIMEGMSQLRRMSFSWGLAWRSWSDQLVNIMVSLRFSLMWFQIVSIGFFFLQRFCCCVPSICSKWEAQGWATKVYWGWDSHKGDHASSWWC